MTEIVKSLRRAYDKEVYISEAERLVGGLGEVDLSMWAANDATKALLLLLEGSIVEVMFGWKQGKFDSEHSQEYRGYCNGLEQAIEFIETIKKRDI